MAPLTDSASTQVMRDAQEHLGHRHGISHGSVMVLENGPPQPRQHERATERQRRTPEPRAPGRGLDDSDVEPRVMGLAAA